MTHSLPILTCQGCVAHCCRYVAMEIVRPRAARDHRYVMSVLQHPRIAVTEDHDRRWYVEFAARCGALTDRNMCGIYLDRPRLCRDYRLDTCPRWNPGSPHRLRFETAETYQAWLAGQGRAVAVPPAGPRVHVPIETPRAKRAWDELVWMVLHRETRLIVDRRGRWFVEFETGLGASGPCQFAPEQPYRQTLDTRDALVAYLDRLGIDWRFRTPAAPGPAAAPRPPVAATA